MHKQACGEEPAESLELCNFLLLSELGGGVHDLVFE